MLYENFKELIDKNNISVQEIEKALGYAKNSIYNNWDKNKDIPKHAAISINLYIELLNIKKENQKLKQQIKKDSPLKTMLSSEILAMAETKCNDNNINIEQYISSLIIAHI